MEHFVYKYSTKYVAQTVYIHEPSIKKKYDSVMMQFTLLALVFGFGSVLGQDEVTTKLGKIKGKSFTTRNGRTVSGYLGIPYAKPPTGKLRFKKPEPYTDQYDDEGLAAVVDANMCPQLDDNGVVVGDEDCLYLNVYTPAESPDAPLPTMVYIHGGHFVKGSARSTEAGPEYLLDKNIVLVTLNYRLGALGFLSTGDSVSPGNNGLKDQYLALRWINDNIADFHGDANQVTIFGNDAGGASVCCHVIFKGDEGLFKQYISQSGSGGAIWAFEDSIYAIKHSQDLGNLVKCPTSDSQALVDCLRDVDVKSLVDSNKIFENSRWKINTWVPTAEEDTDDAFVTVFPTTKLLFTDPQNIRGIIGNVNDEGLYLTAELYKNESFYDTVSNENFDFMKQIVDLVFNENMREKFVVGAKDFYFMDVSPDDKDAFIKAWTQVITDVAYRFPEDYQNTFMINELGDNLFVYNFDYRGSYSRTSNIMGSNEDIGVTQGDLLVYLFPVKKSDYRLTDSDNKMVDIVIDFWTSFAKTGTPTSKALPDPNVWKSCGSPPTIGLKIGDENDPEAIEIYRTDDKYIQYWTTAINSRIYDSYILGSLGKRTRSLL